MSRHVRPAARRSAPPRPGAHGPAPQGCGPQGFGPGASRADPRPPSAAGAGPDGAGPDGADPDGGADPGARLGLVGAVAAVTAGARGAVTDALADALAEAKPRLRGWLHAAAFPAALAAGIVLVCLAGGTRARVASILYAVSVCVLFGVSAVYHRGTWSPRTATRLRRLDHSNIFIVIAGSYTPFALLVLHGVRSWTILTVVWGGALLGVTFRVLWLSAPRWLYVPLYVALGWVAVFFIPALIHAGVAVAVLLLAGGALYTAGGVVYALRRPNPSPRWFGFHEVFHACTLGGWVTQFVAVSLIAIR